MQANLPLQVREAIARIRYCGPTRTAIVDGRRLLFEELPTRILAAIHLPRGQDYIRNIVKGRPAPGHRTLDVVRRFRGIPQ